jgi:hypothetical protein
MSCSFLAVVVLRCCRWEQQGQPDVSVLRQLVKEGYYLRLSIPKEFGGLGLTDWRYHAVVTEELENADIGSFFLNLGNDMVLSYFTRSATREQQARWLPKIVANGSVIAIAMSEPEVSTEKHTTHSHTNTHEGQNNTRTQQRTEGKGGHAAQAVGGTDGCNVGEGTRRRDFLFFEYQQ